MDPLQPPDRRAPRYDIEVRITVESATNFYTGFTMNISEGGVFVAMADPPAIGQIVRLHVHLGDDKPVRAAGEVKWHRLDENDEVVGCGVQFVALDQESTDALQAMLGRAGQDPLLME